MSDAKTVTIRLTVTMGDEGVEVTRTVQPEEFEGSDSYQDLNKVAEEIGAAARSAVAALTPGSWPDPAMQALRRGVGAIS